MKSIYSNENCYSPIIYNNYSNTVNPSVNEVSSIDNNNESEDVDLTSNEVEVRDEEKVYYLDSNNKTYKKCFDTCKRCNDLGIEDKNI